MNLSIQSKGLQNKTIFIGFGKYFERLYLGNSKTGLNGKTYNFPVSFETIDINDIVSIHKFLMKIHNMV